MKRLLPPLPVRVGCLMAMMLLVSCASENPAYTPEQRANAEMHRRWREENHLTQEDEDEEHPVLEAVQKVLAVPTFPILLFFEMLKGMKPV